MKNLGFVRWSVLLILLGLSFEVLSAFRVTPMTFILFAAAGLPLIVAGMLLFGIQSWRESRKAE